jgi:hypothetical protein
VCVHTDTGKTVAFYGWHGSRSGVPGASRLGLTSGGGRAP